MSDNGKVVRFPAAVEVASPRLLDEVKGFTHSLTRGQLINGLSAMVEEFAADNPDCSSPVPFALVIFDVCEALDLLGEVDLILPAPALQALGDWMDSRPQLREKEK